MSAMRRINWLT